MIQTIIVAHSKLFFLLDSRSHTLLTAPYLFWTTLIFIISDATWSNLPTRKIQRNSYFGITVDNTRKLSWSVNASNYFIVVADSKTTSRRHLLYLLLESFNCITLLYIHTEKNVVVPSLGHTTNEFYRTWM